MPGVSESRWPHIGQEELFDLWRKHGPGFIHLDNPDRDLLQIRDTFLTWLVYKGVELGRPEEVRIGKRARIQAVKLVQRGVEAEALVTLTLNGRFAEATQVGFSSGDDLLKLPAQATLSALNKLIPVVGFDVEWATTASRGDGLSVALVSISDSADHLIGACSVEGSLPEAGAKAAMAAINRRAEIAAAMMGI